MNWIAEVLENHTKENPDHRFLFDAQHSDGLAFKELYELSGRVYAYLKANGIGREDFVLINLTRGVKPFVALTGVLRCGAAFTMVENTDPPKRIKYIYNDCNCKLEINEAVWEDILKTEPLQGYEDVNNHDAAYAVYTSGTTGNPKGIIHEYRNLKETYDSFYYEGTPIFSQDEKYAMISSINFVASIIPFVLLLDKTKSELHIISRSIAKDSQKLLSYLSKNCITSTFLPPSYIQVLGAGKLLFLRTLILSSEPANNIRLPEGVSVYNSYVMSESGYFVGIFKIDRQYDICPIGHPQFDKKVYILDENGNEVADGEVGEFCFDNPFVRGYINLPEENKRAFQNGIFHSNDLAKRLPNTDYVIIGRKNDMVKINGNRVEPAEVEAVVRNELDIDWCGVRGFEDYENAYLAAYYTADISININELRKKLSKRLPYYMIPAHFIKIDKIPVNQNGKFDRKSLPLPVLKSEEVVLPKNKHEVLLLNIVKKIFGTENIGVTTDLINYGLTSMQVIKLTELAKEEKCIIKADDVFKLKTIRAILSSNKKIGEWYYKFDKNKPTLVFLAGFVPFIVIQPFIERLSKIYNCFLYERIHDHYYTVFEGETIDDMVLFYKDALDSQLPDGVKIDVIAGYCYGGEIAIKMANKYAQEYNEYPTLFLWETFLREEKIKPLTEEEKDAMLKSVSENMIAETKERIKAAEIAYSLSKDSNVESYNGECRYYEATKDYENNIINLAIKASSFEEARKINENLVKKYIPNVKIVSLDADHLDIFEKTKNSDLIL